MLPIMAGLFVVGVIAVLSVCFDENQIDKVSEKHKLQLIRRQLDELREDV